MILLSCAALSPVSMARGGLASFADIEEVVPEWQPLEADVDFFSGKIVRPKLEFWVVRFDLASQEKRIVVKGGSGDDPTLNTKVSSFVRDNGLIAGINAVPFDIVTGKEGIPVTNIGIVISDGRLIAPVSPSFDALVIYTDGRAAIVSQTAIRSFENIESAAGGFFQVLKSGELADRTLELEERHPRSAAGISAN
ncbi:MAG: phosphodiester glycosidase family protein, partial [Treponema sp.]|nr:phosphodiester glycosidase family protein [Treponema sp.]